MIDKLANYNLSNDKVERVRGRWVKGHTTWNKGRKGYTAKTPEAEDRIKAGLETGRKGGHRRPDNEKRLGRAVAFFSKNGIPNCFDSIARAGRWLIAQGYATSENGAKRNIIRSCNKHTNAGGVKWYYVDSEDFVGLFKI